MLPQGITFENNRIQVDLGALADRYGIDAFGYLTALEESRSVIDAAHIEACSVQNCV